MFLRKNLRFLRERNNKESQTKLAESVGVTRSAVSSYEDGRAEPRLEVLSLFADHFNITVDQLINVELSKLDDIEIKNKRNIENYVAGKNMRILTVTMDAQDSETIALVPDKAAAGYTMGYADEEYLSELPRYQLPFLPKNRTYRAFEIAGESMLPLQPNSIVIAEYMADWNDIKDGQVCIVVSKTEGIVLKRVYNNVDVEGSFLLKSTNILYQPFELPAQEVLEIWRFAAYISRGFPEESSTSTHDLKEVYWRLEDEMRSMRHKLDGAGIK